MRVQMDITVPLFLVPKAEHEKSASGALSRMPDDEKRWPLHVHSELLKELPYLADYDVEIVMDRIEAEAGVGLGYAQIHNKTLSRPQDSARSAGNVIRIPIIIQDRRLQKFLVFEAGGEVFPLTEERIQQAMLNPALFDTDAQTTPKSPSLLENLFPPYQHRTGFGKVTEPAAMGLNKLSSAYMSKEALNLTGGGAIAGGVLGGLSTIPFSIHRHNEAARNGQSASILRTGLTTAAGVAGGAALGAGGGKLLKTHLAEKAVAKAGKGAVQGAEVAGKGAVQGAVPQTSNGMPLRPMPPPGGVRTPPPSVAPPSVAPPSVAPPSVAPPPPASNTRLPTGGAPQAPPQQVAAPPPGGAPQAPPQQVAAPPPGAPPQAPAPPPGVRSLSDAQLKEVDELHSQLLRQGMEPAEAQKHIRDLVSWFASRGIKTSSAPFSKLAFNPVLGASMLGALSGAGLGYGSTRILQTPEYAARINRGEIPLGSAAAEEYARKRNRQALINAGVGAGVGALSAGGGTAFLRASGNRLVDAAAASLHTKLRPALDESMKGLGANLGAELNSAVGAAANGAGARARKEMVEALHGIGVEAGKELRSALHGGTEGLGGRLQKELHTATEGLGDRVGEQLRGATAGLGERVGREFHTATEGLGDRVGEQLRGATAGLGERVSDELRVGMHNAVPEASAHMRTIINDGLEGAGARLGAELRTALEDDQLGRNVNRQLRAAVTGRSRPTADQNVIAPRTVRDRLASFFRRGGHDKTSSMPLLNSFLKESALVAEPAAAIVVPALQPILVTLLALYQAYRHAHWVANDTGYYGDHQLFERLYDAVEEEYDKLAERIVMYGGADALNRGALLAEAGSTAAEWLGQSADSEESPVASLVEAEKQFLATLLNTKTMLDTNNAISMGLEAFLSEMASNHEDTLYLLLRRLSTAQQQLGVDLVQQGAAAGNPAAAQPVSLQQAVKQASEDFPDDNTVARKSNQALPIVVGTLGAPLAAKLVPLTFSGLLAEKHTEDLQTLLSKPAVRELAEKAVAESGVEIHSPQTVNQVRFRFDPKVSFVDYFRKHGPSLAKKGLLPKNVPVDPAKWSKEQIEQLLDSVSNNIRGQLVQATQGNAAFADAGVQNGVELIKPTVMVGDRVSEAALLHELGHANKSGRFLKKYYSLGQALPTRVGGMVGGSLAALYGAKNAVGQGTADERAKKVGIATMLAGASAAPALPMLYEEGRASALAAKALMKHKGNMGRAASLLLPAFGSYAASAAVPLGATAGLAATYLKLKHDAYKQRKAEGR